MSWHRFVRVMILGCAALALGGCGGPADQRFDVSGSATVGGSPIQQGSILFEPDLSKGNHGPAGFAVIKDGKYDTAIDGKGTIGGPHIVKIIGSVADSDTAGSLFSDYQTSVDLPAQTASQDFDVPASAKLPKRAEPPAGYQGP